MEQLHIEIKNSFERIKKMANLEGMKMKYFLIKCIDVSLLELHEIDQFSKLLNKIKDGRKSEGKKENTYLVVNTDEAYADEVIEIMKHHGHWG
jgi:hypothetical protein